MSWDTYTANNELMTNARAANAIDISGTIVVSGGTWIHLTARAP